MLNNKQQGFGTLSLYAGIAVFVVVTALCGAIGYQSKKIDRLNKQIATLEVTADLYMDTIDQAQVEMARLLEINEECANARAEATRRGDAAEKALYEALRKAKQRSQERVDEIAKDNRGLVCSAPVPARTVELLVAAAHSANRSEAGN